MYNFFMTTLLALVVQANIAHSMKKNCICVDNINEIEDGTAVQKMHENIEFLNASNENLRLQLNLLNARIQQQEDDLKNVNRICVNELPENCFEATKATNKSGVYKIELKYLNRLPFYVSCNAEQEDGGWLVVLRRQDGSISFDKNWQEYRQGFGHLNGDFFIGLDKLHDLTKNSLQELLIVMEDFNNTRRYAKYDAFAIESEADGYAMSVLGKYSGNAGDSLIQHSGFQFTTKDSDRDNAAENCAIENSGGWWYHACYTSHLTGIYFTPELSKKYSPKGITWHSFRGYENGMKFVEMMIRPRLK